MSRNKAQFFMALALGLVLTLPAFAQEEGGQRRGGRRGGDREGGQRSGQRGGFSRSRGGFSGFSTINKARLLGAKQVRKELKVTEEQGKKLDGVLASYAEEARKIRPQRSRGGFDRGGRGGRGGERGGDQRRRRRPTDDDDKDDKGTEVSLQERPERPSDEEREKARKEYEKKRAALEAKFEKQIAEILKKEQVTRLNEIHYQQQGVRALLMASTVKTLKITKDQTKKIEEIIKKGSDKRRELFSGLRRGGERPDFTEIRKKMDALTKETFKEAVASLKKEQQEGHKKLTGKPFELDRRALFQRGGSERGGRGGARGGSRGGERGGDSDRRRRRPSDDDA